MSETEEGRQGNERYFTCSRARSEGNAELVSGILDTDSEEQYYGADSDADSGNVSAEETEQEPDNWMQDDPPGSGQHERIARDLLSTLLVLNVRRRLSFNPLPPRPVARMQQPPLPPNPPVVLQNPKVRVAKFRGKSKEDPDCHVAQFQTRWVASGYDGMYGDAVKQQHFASTFEDKAMKWYSQFGAAHFATFDALKNAFLGRFRLEKTRNDVIKKVKSIK